MMKSSHPRNQRILARNGYLALLSHVPGSRNPVNLFLPMRLKRTIGAIFSLGIILGTVVFLSPASATVGWGAADLALDFGVSVEPGESYLIIGEAEVGHPFDVEVTWKLHPRHCRLQARYHNERGGNAESQSILDDHTLGGNPAHAVVANLDALFLIASKEGACEIDPARDEYLMVKERKDLQLHPLGQKNSPPLGATVAILRGTSFFTPKVVTIHTGERVVWVYADGAGEPHTVTSGKCRESDCSGGGRKFQSGRTLNKPGDRFEYTFTHPGRFDYHCDLHTATMKGTVIVRP